MPKKRKKLLIAGGPSFDIPGKKTTGLGGMTPGDVERLKKGNPGASGKIDEKYKGLKGGVNLPLAKKKKKKIYTA
tara:strand:- start:209 stop:433 length:225 start_codon:yes stop_codon:yes gene_type:complete